MGVPNVAAWKEERLADICKLISRGTAPVYVDDSTVLAIGQRCVRDKGFDSTAARAHNPRVRNVLRVEPGDVLLNSTGTGTIGRSCVFNGIGDFIVDGHVTVVRVDPSKVEPVWIDALLRSSWGQKHLESHCFTGSTNQVELSRIELLDTTIPVPPIAEQRRIVELLDAVEEQLVSAGRELSKRAAVRCGLAVDCVNTVVEASGEERPLGELAAVAGGVTLGSEPTGGSSVELPYLRVANVQDGYFDTAEMKSVRVLRSQVADLALKQGDLLLTEGGDWDKLGRGAVWDCRIEPCIYQNHIFRVRCDRRLILPEYLSLYTSSPIGRAYFTRIAKQTSNLATINSTELKAMPVPAPSLELQDKLVAAIRDYDLSIQRARDTYESVKALKAGLMEDLLSGRVRV